MRYLRPLRSGDRFRGTCRVSKATGARLVFEQQLWLLPPRSSGAAHSSRSSSSEEQQQQEQLVMTAEAVVVSLDASYKPKRLSPHLRELLLAGVPAAGHGPAMQLQELL
jgi:acyl-CoA thioesterase FadM